MPAPTPDPVGARGLLDLLDLCDDRSRAIDRLRGADPSDLNVGIVADLLCPSGDRTTKSAICTQLAVLGLPGYSLTSDAVNDLACKLELSLNIGAELAARMPLPASRLVVTATSAPELAELQRQMRLPPLVQLIEDVIRTATSTCVLGAPYWNTAALERLWPSLQGFVNRRGAVEIVCQGGVRGDEYDPLPALRRLATDLRAAGGNASIWTFDAHDARGESALLHAKFALADERFGYLGSANMTGQGFGHHFEIGVRLGPPEAVDLVRLLNELKGAGFLNCDAGSR